MKYEEAVAMIDAGHSISADQIREFLGSDDGYLRWAGLKACGAQKLESAVDTMIDAISRPSTAPDTEDLTAVAAWSMSQFSQALLDSLVPKMTSSQVDAVRIAAADLLGLATHADEIQYLSLLIRDSETDVAKWAALSLSKKGSAGLSPLVSALNDAKDEMHAGIALEAISKLQTPEARAICNEFIARPGNEVFKTLF